MAHDVEAARARAEASFRKPEPPGGGGAAEAERALREKTERLREMRLAKEAVTRHGAEIRSNRRRGA